MSRLIDADVFKKNMDYVCTMGGWLEPISSAITEYVKKHIDAQTTVDAVKVVRCNDCVFGKVYQNDSSGVMGRFCEAFTQVRMVSDDDYCSYGKERP